MKTFLVHMKIGGKPLLRNVTAVLLWIFLIAGCEKSIPIQHVRFSYQGHTIDLDIRVDSLTFIHSISNSIWEGYGLKPPEEPAARNDSGFKLVASITNLSEQDFIIRCRAIEYYSENNEFLQYHHRGQGSGELIWNFRMRLRGKTTEQWTFYLEPTTDKIVFYDSGVNEFGVIRKTRKLFEIPVPKLG